MQIQILNAITNRRKNEFGYMFVENNKILRDGNMQYRGSELPTMIENVAVDKDKIYNVKLTKEEMEKAKDSVKLIPLINNHIWVDKENTSKGKQIGSVGENIAIKNEDNVNYMICNLAITDAKIVNEVENGKSELSTAYDCKLKLSNTADADFEVYDLNFNHLAIVNNGRAGNDVRIANSFNKTSSDEDKNLQKIQSNISRKDYQDSDSDDKLIEKNNEKNLTLKEKVTKLDTEKEQFFNKMSEKKDLIAEVDTNIVSVANEECNDKKEEKIEAIKKHEKEEINHQKEGIKEDKEVVKKLENSADELRVSIENSIKEELKEKSKIFNSVKGIVGDLDIFATSKEELVDLALEKMGVKFENSVSFEAKKFGLEVAINKSNLQKVENELNITKLANANFVGEGKFECEI